MAAAYLLVSAPPNICSNTLKSTKILSCSIPVGKLDRLDLGSEVNNSNIASKRVADYKPSIWVNEFLQSLRNDYAGETYKKRAQKLKAEVESMLSNKTKLLDQLELIQVLQRLGLAYHFDEEISKTLENTYNCTISNWDARDLYETALEFTLLRQHGYHASQDVFKRFLNKNGNFDECIRADIRGMLSLYEASFLSVDNESIMEEAYVFTYKHLEEVKKSSKLLEKQNVETELVSHALDLPLHWRMTRLEARWYIDVYEKDTGMNPIILELAKLDYNIVQAQHQQELGDVSWWWKTLGLVERLSFARDRLVEAYLWTIGTTFVPRDAYSRKKGTAAVALLTVIDDIYDVHGTLDKLVLFTGAVERWDIRSIVELPDYMKIAFIAIFNHVNEMSYEILKEQDVDVLPYLTKAWLDLFTAYLQEAKWYDTGYKPTLEEYMNNARITIGGPLLQMYAYISTTKTIKKEALEYLESGPEIVRLANLVLRLCNDFATSEDEQKRGDVPKAIQCHMYDTGVCEEISREQMRVLIRQSWKKINRYTVIESRLPKRMVELILNFPRISHTMYQYGDGHSKQDDASKKLISSLLVKPIPL